jgi:hypothetical protein
MFGVWLVIFIWGYPVINEVMTNPLGPESGAGSPGDRNEYVEIYNPGDTTVNLSGYFIADLTEKDSLIPYPDSSILHLYPGVILGYEIPPGGYAIILDPEYLNPESLYPQPYNIGDGTVVLSITDSDIGNGLSASDFIFLIEPDGDTVDFDTSGLSPPDGISRERRDPNLPGYPSNWRLSRWNCTPGSINSWSLPVDIAIDSSSFSYSPTLPVIGDSIVFNFNILNLGLEGVSGFALFYSYGEIYDSVFPSGFLSRDDTLSLSFTLKTLLEGYERMEIILYHPDDADTSNNRLLTSLLIGKSPIVINEIMYDDSVEWIEIYNRSSKTVDLSGWRVIDKAGKESQDIGNFPIEPDSYLVLSGDSAFSFIFPGVQFIPLSPFPTLNNNEEEISLLDSFGTVIDRVPYKKSWGGKRGYSLERVSPELPSNMESSWGTCVDVRGATPGERNSIFLVPGNDKDVLKLSSRVITPNNDGKNDRVLITFSIPEKRAKVNILIFDAIGRVVRKLYRGETDSGMGQIIWDGTDDSGILLPTGLYIIYFEAKIGEKLLKSKRTIALKR